MRRSLHLVIIICAASFALFTTYGTAQNITSPTLESVRNRGSLACGVNDNLQGFAKANSLREYSGFNIDLCRAVSAAIFADADKVRFISNTDNNRFQELNDGKFDILIRNTVWTLSRDVSLGDFAGINFYDGQGFITWKRARVRNALELDNVSLCVQSNSNAESVASRYFAINRMRYKPILFNTPKDAIEAYSEGACDALTANHSTLTALRLSQDTPDAHNILSEVISKAPLGPMVRANDSGWANAVRWSLNCMINAEELSITQANVDEIDENSPLDVQRLAGISGDYGVQLGLRSTWCTDIIRTVGNYGESYERHLGQASAVNLPRGVNNLWTNGGLIFAPPIR